MNDTQARFQQLLRELFEFDCADLDFGIYRIMNHKREVIERFIADDLPRAISEELAQGALAREAALRQKLTKLAQQIRENLSPGALDVDGRLAEAFHNTKLGQCYLELQAQAARARSHEALEAQVYNHLYTFFSRYYQDGDFISKRRYSKKERYAIPYNGEEVYLYWANHDQYYIKTGEYFTDYSYKAPNGVTVHFKLKAANVEQNNVKGEKRFFVPRMSEVTWEETASLPGAEASGTMGQLTIPFEFRPLTEQELIRYGQKNQQDAIVARAVEELPKQVRAGAALAALTAERRTTADGRSVSYLEHHLRQYTRRNTSDFFIHKDLKGFLSRELDFYLKNEVLNLDEMERAGEQLAEGWLQLVRLIKKVGNRIIDFLAQIEDFQKMLWEKRKFVTETFYCITVGNIPEAFYPEIATCEPQWEEWKRLYAIDELPDYPASPSPSPHRGEGGGEGRKSRTREERNDLLEQFARDMRHAPTRAEERLWYFLRDRQLAGYKFRRQHPMGPYIADLVCIEARLIVELDGEQHAEPSRQQQDTERTRFFESRGFRVLRFWNDEVLSNTEGVLERILDELESAPHPNPLPSGEREQFLKAHPTLVLDTRHFPPEFVDRLLASFDDLDEATDGLLVHSENWQALRSLGEQYRNKIDLVYIDPPYNTGDSEIPYKNGYLYSSWLGLMKGRLASSLAWLCDDPSLFIAIDDFEMPDLCELVDRSLPSLRRQMIVVNHHPQGGKSRALATTHEYMLACLRTGSRRTLLGRAHNDGSEHRPFKRSGTAPSNYRYARPNSFYAILVDPASKRVVGVEPPPRWDDSSYPKGRTDDGYVRVYPLGAGGEERVWRRSYESCLPLVQQGRLICSDNLTIYQLVHLGERRAALFSNWTHPRYNAGTFGANLLRDIIGQHNAFAYPKSLHTVADAAFAAGFDEGWCLDYFAGSGTTGHAVINLNREDGGRRKFILVEMAEYFDTVLLPRIKKVTFSPEWKEGKPKRLASAEEAARSPRIVKVIRLESYEDALNNLAFDEPPGQQALQFEDYLLRYMLKWETRHSETLLNVEKLSKPFAYCLHIHRDGETRTQPVDLPETFNYLLGLDVRSRRVHSTPPSPQRGEGRGEGWPSLLHGEAGGEASLSSQRGEGRGVESPSPLRGEGGGEGRYLVYRGTTRDGQRVAVIWRDTDGWAKEDYERDRDFVASAGLAEGADMVYVNGDSLIPGAQALEPIFKARMFAPVEE